MVPVELQLSLGAPVARTEASKRNGEKEREGLTQQQEKKKKTAERAIQMLCMKNPSLHDYMKLNDGISSITSRHLQTPLCL